jgi:hypothetical protein
LDLSALTDPNSAKNCPALAGAAARVGLGFVPGMELCTAEEIHVLCLFPDVERALDFDGFVHSRMLSVPNRPDIFGRQIVMGADDRPAEEEPLLLHAATSIMLQELPALAALGGGIVIPAHIDRESNGLLSVLGAFPPDFAPAGAEICAALPAGLPPGLPIIQSSDAHRLWEILHNPPALPLPSPDFAGLCAWLYGQSTY